MCADRVRILLLDNGDVAAVTTWCKCIAIFYHLVDAETKAIDWISLGKKKKKKETKIVMQLPIYLENYVNSCDKFTQSLNNALASGDDGRRIHFPCCFRSSDVPLPSIHYTFASLAIFRLNFIFICQWFDLLSGTLRYRRTRAHTHRPAR